jgi:hypothetical protein
MRVRSEFAKAMRLRIMPPVSRRELNPTLETPSGLWNLFDPHFVGRGKAHVLPRILTMVQLRKRLINAESKRNKF